MNHPSDTFAAGPTGADAGEVERLRTSNADLRAQLAAAERRLAAYEQPMGDGAPEAPDDLKALWAAIERRFGLVPSFFRLAADAPAVAWNLWRQAEFAYLDSPLPSLFKERLFAYLSQYCEVPYCVSRHCAFLLGQGHPAGDADAEPLTPEDVLALLTEPAPSFQTLSEHLDLLAETAPGVGWPAPGTPLERALFGCATVIFLTPHKRGRCLRALKRVLGPERFHEFMLFLAFIRTAHFWTEVHPELELEADAEAVLEEYQAIARWIKDAPGTSRTDLRALLQQEHDDLEAARQQLARVERARAELEASEQHLRTILDSLFSFVGVLTPDGTLIEANRAPLTAAGLSFEDVYGRKFWDCYWWSYDPDVQAQLQDACERAAQGEAVRYDVVIRVAGDERMTIDFQLAPLQDADGLVTYMIPSAVDVTEARATAAALQGSEDRFRRAIAEAPVPVLLHAEDGRILQVSRAFTEITGYTPEDVPTIAEWTERAYGERQEQVQADIDRLYGLDGRVDEGEYTVRTAAGERRVWLFSSAPLGRDIDGRRLAISVAADVTERKRAEQALRESEAKRRRLFQQAPALIAAHEGPDHVYAFSNDLHDEAVGHRPLVGRPLREAMPELEGQGVYERFDRAYATGETITTPEFEAFLEREGVRVKGCFYQVLQPWYDADGAVAGVMSFAYDITEQKRTQEALRESQERYRRLFESVNEGFCVFDVLFDDDGTPVDYRFTETNPAFVRHTGLVDAEGRTARELVPGLETHWFETYGRIATTGEPERFILEAEPMGRWFQVDAFRVGGPESRRVAALFSNITERIGAERALRESEERLRLALDAARMGTWTFDPDTDEAVIDERERALLGFAPDEAEVRGADVFDRIHPDDRAPTRAAVDVAFEDGNDYEAEFRINHPERGLRWIAGRGRVIRTDDAQQLLGVNFDITALKRAEEEVRRMSVRLVHAGERERQHIARELHDELGGMLTSLQMSLQMNPGEGPAAQNELRESRGLAKAMLDKVRQLSLDLRPSLLDDLGLAPALEQLVQRFTAQTRIDVDLHCEIVSEQRFPAEIETTAYRIVQAALTNVARHAGVDRAQVLCHHEPGRLALHIADEGRGFDPADLGDSESSTGLAIMCERAAMVGGRCEVASHPSAGTRITATLPVPEPSSTPGRG